MNCTTILPFPRSDRSALLAVDVHEAELFVFCSLAVDSVIFRRFDNRTRVIEEQLTELRSLALDAGFGHVVVVSEPSGVYHFNLLRTARRLGMGTALVNPEAVKKMRVVESNDDGKTDHKDPRVISLLAQLGKTLLHRQLPETYQLLREYGRLYDHAEEAIRSAKISIHPLLTRLFPDLDFGNAFYFHKSGRAIERCYGFNPYRMVRAGRSRLERRLRKEAPGIHQKTIDRLLSSALESVRSDLPPRIQEALEAEITLRYEDLDLQEKRRQVAKEKLLEFYREAREEDPHLPAAERGVVSEINLARLVGETGPLSDFVCWKQVYRYLGMNLRERQSGTYRGKTKLAKKGRARGRKIMGLIALPLAKKHALFGTYHHSKKETMQGSKAMAATSRKILKMLFGWYRTGGAFDRNRVFHCESQFAKAA